MNRLNGQWDEQGCDKNMSIDLSKVMNDSLDMLEVLEPRLLLSALPVDWSQSGDIPSATFINSGQSAALLVDVDQVDGYDSNGQDEVFIGPLQESMFQSSAPAPGVGLRVDDGLQVFYGFIQGAGSSVLDLSGVGDPLDLTIADIGNIAWGEGVLTVNAATIISSGQPADKISEAVKVSNEITIEAWISSADLGQNGPARIITLSDGPFARDFTLGQGVYNTTGDRIDARLRTTDTGLNGSSPSLSSPVGSLTAAMTHVVYTRSSDGSATLYMDNVVITSGTISGDLSNWDVGYELALANEFGGSRPWLGTFDLVAVYDRALDAGEVAQNFAAGSDASAPNIAPVAEDDFAEIDEDTLLTVAQPGVLDNDTDLDSLGLTVTAFDALSAAGAIVTVNSDGSYTYDPSASPSLQSLAVNESTIDTFTYVADDGDGGSDTATVYITVNGVNDQPTATDNSYITFNDANLAGDAVNDDTGQGVDADIDAADTLTVIKVNGNIANVGVAVLLSSGATLTMQSNGQFDYDPTTSVTLSTLLGGESADDSFTYSISDVNGSFSSSRSLPNTPSPPGPGASTTSRSSSSKL